MIVRGVVVWLLLLVLTVANGFFRESLLVPQMGVGGGRIVSTLLLSALILGAIAGRCQMTSRGIVID